MAKEEHLFEVYQKKLRERMNEMADTVATGSAQNFDEYRKMCGIIEGLALAERELLDLFDALEKGKE